MAKASKKKERPEKYEEKLALKNTSFKDVFKVIKKQKEDKQKKKASMELLFEEDYKRPDAEMFRLRILKDNSQIIRSITRVSLTSKLSDQVSTIKVS